MLDSADATAVQRGTPGTRPPCWLRKDDTADHIQMREGLLKEVIDVERNNGHNDGKEIRNLPQLLNRDMSSPDAHENGIRLLCKELKRMPQLRFCMLTSLIKLSMVVDRDVEQAIVNW